MVGLLLKDWRVERGLTQREAGELVGVSAAAWSSWEVGTKKPGVANSVRLSDLTDGLVSVRAWHMAQPASPPAP